MWSRNREPAEPNAEAKSENHVDLTPLLQQRSSLTYTAALTALTSLGFINISIAIERFCNSWVGGYLNL